MDAVQLRFDIWYFVLFHVYYSTRKGRRFRSNWIRVKGLKYVSSVYYY